MSAKRLSMRKTREIIRLKHTTDLSDRRIAAACDVSPSTVGAVARAAEKSGLSWPLPEDLSDSRLESRLFDNDRERLSQTCPRPDMERIARELKRKHVTLQLLWEEYRREHPHGYSYSRFCELFREWKGSRDPVMRHEHQAGDRMFVDWTGQPFRYTDRRGRRHEAFVFVAVLGASHYIYTDIFPDMKLNSWLRAHIRAFEFYGGVPQAVVPDNTRTGVTSPCRYDPELNPSYQQLAEHYNTAVVPARSRKPRDKATVENAVRTVGQRIIAALREANLNSFAEAAEAVRRKREELNKRPFSKTEGCRRGLFEEIEKDTLKPLPGNAFTVGEWRKATVYKDYHIQLGKYYYSVHYSYIGRKVDVRLTDHTLEIYYDRQRIAVHRRYPKKGRCSTAEEHRPPKHTAVVNRSAEKFIARAAGFGENCVSAIKAQLNRFPHMEMAFRSCEGLLRLGGRFGADRLETACKRAIEDGDPRYRHIVNMLENNRENFPRETEDEPEPVSHGNVRGSSYYAALRRQGGEQC